MSKIPKIIHITSKEKTEANKILINYLKKLHPNFVVKYYDDLKCMEVLKTILVMIMLIVLKK